MSKSTRHYRSNSGEQQATEPASLETNLGSFKVVVSLSLITPSFRVVSSPALHRRSVTDQGRLQGWSPDEGWSMGDRIPGSKLVAKREAARSDYESSTTMKCKE